MIEAYLFYIAFVAQILVMSVLFPYRYLQHVKGSLDRHPPATNPELYPLPAATALKAMNIYKQFNRGIALTGFITFFFCSTTCSKQIGVRAKWL